MRMNHETRKINLKKLHLIGVKTDEMKTSREMRSSKTLATAEISQYFSKMSKTTRDTSKNESPQKLELEMGSNIENIGEMLVEKCVATEALDARMSSSRPKRSSHLKMTSFLYKSEHDAESEKMLPKRSDVFETPKRTIKKAPKMTKAKLSTRQRKQQLAERRPTMKVNKMAKSPFLCEEQLFAEITAQHSRADDFNPDEIQLALALSKSQAESNDVAEARTYITTDGDHDVAANIRSKLERYGFRTAAKEDYSAAVATAFPRNANVPHLRKTKWANKFTPLTLRDPEQQLRKVEKKVDGIMRTVDHGKRSTVDLDPVLQQQHHIVEPYKVCCHLLKRAMATSERRIFDGKEEMANVSVLEDYYVVPLFEVTSVAVGHLLKDWQAIPGRDLSPRLKCSSVNRHEEQKFNEAYEELQSIFIDKAANAKRKRDSCTAHDNKRDDYKRNERSAVGFLVQKAVKGNNTDITAQDEFCRPGGGLSQDHNVEHNNDLTMSMINNFTQRSRAISPDIFADSDDEVHIVDQATVPEIPIDRYVQKQKEDDEEARDDILTTFEQYSSDEDKMNANYSRLCVMRASMEKPLTCNDAGDLLCHGAIGDDSTNDRSRKEREEFADELRLIDRAIRKSSSFAHLEEEMYRTVVKCEKRWNLHSHDGLTTEYAGDIMDETEQDVEMLENECIILSDDEINYSMWKANATNDTSPNILVDVLTSSDESSTLDDNVADVVRMPFTLTEDDTSRRSHAMNLDHESMSNESDTFDIPTGCSQYTVAPPSSDGADEAPTWDFSFLDAQSESTAPMKQYSHTGGVSPKFQQLLQSITMERSPALHLIDNNIDNCVNECSSQFQDRRQTLPHEFEQLLTGEIPLPHHQHDDIHCRVAGDGDDNDDDDVMPFVTSPKELNVGGRIYQVRVTTSPRPNFASQSDDELLRRLHKYGIKPLKRPQASKMLEYIYTQLHPLLAMRDDVTDDSHSTKDEHGTSNSSQGIIFGPTQQSQTSTTSVQQFKFTDCSGEVLLRCPLNAAAHKLSDEEYIFQTNISKKVSQPLLPLHLAWYNLVCSHVELNEAILIYTPIDLQEVYLFLKSMGYRYDPKDLKRFFDNRCITFRYNLTPLPPSSSHTNRHIRKSKSSRSKS